MCDYSLHSVKSRPAKVGDKLTTRNFNTGTRGFAAPEDASTAVCVLPGTELDDALEFPDGQIVLLTDLFEYQEATVLQLPAQPATAAEAKAQERVTHVG
jgi:hypothetical protein